MFKRLARTWLPQGRYIQWRRRYFAMYRVVGDVVNAPAQLIRMGQTYPMRVWPLYLADALGAWMRQRICAWRVVGYTVKPGIRLFVRPFTEDRTVIDEVFGQQVYTAQRPIRAGDIVVDIGAHIGVFTVFAAAAHPTVRVFSYEPMPENLDLLRKNLRLNRVRAQVLIEPLAVAGSSGQQPFYVNWGSGMGTLDKPRNSEQVLMVSQTTIEALMATHGLSHIDVLKMDIEGAEYDVCDALSDSVLRRIECLTMEGHIGDPPRERRRERFERLRARLESLGFAVTVKPGVRPSLCHLVALQPSVTAAEPADACVER